MSVPHAVVSVRCGCGHFDRYDLEPGETLLLDTAQGLNLPPLETGTPQRCRPYQHSLVCRICQAIEDHLAIGKAETDDLS